jgi:hypothetical protein
MFIALIESEDANIATEHKTFSDAIKVADNIATRNEYGHIYAIGIFETDKPNEVMGAENIKKKCKHCASLRTVR